MNSPLLRLYLQDATLPEPMITHRPGCWVFEETWPPVSDDRWMTFIPESKTSKLLNSGSLTSDIPCYQATVSFSACCGSCGGEWLSFGGPDVPVDQRADDAVSLCWTTDTLNHDVPIMGNPSLVVSLSSSNSNGILVARICDVFQDGTSTLVTYGVLNLTHRDGHTPKSVAPLEEGKLYTITIELVSIGYTIPKGHRLRLAVSTSYWPLVWPSSSIDPVTIHTGPTDGKVKTSTGPFATKLILPVCTLTTNRQLEPFSKPRLGPPALIQVQRPDSFTRTSEVETSSNIRRVRIHDDWSRFYLFDADAVIDDDCTKIYTIEEGNPLSASVEIEHITKTEWPNAPGGSIKTTIKTHSKMWAAQKHFYATNKLQAFHGQDVVFEREWKHDIPRLFV